ncbi:HAD family hydrolase [Agromyces seonyuensis]
MSRPAATGAAPVVLFDLDDTLMAHRDAVRAGIFAHVRALAYDGEPAAADALWHELEERHYHAYLGGTLTFEGQRRARARDFAAAHGHVIGDEESGRWFADYFEHYREAWALHADALPALDALEAVLPGVRFGIITNGEAGFQQRKLEQLGIAGRFEHVVASGAIGVTKPDRRIFDAAVAAFVGEDTGPSDPDGSPPAAVYVGDRLATDALGAARAGLLGIWLDRGIANAEAADPALRDEALEAGVIRIQGLDELAPLLVGRFGG